MKFCKRESFAKNLEDDEGVQDVLRKYFYTVNEHYHYLISKSQYPVIR